MNAVEATQERRRLMQEIEERTRGLTRETAQNTKDWASSQARLAREIDNTLNPIGTGKEAPVRASYNADYGIQGSLTKLFDAANKVLNQSQQAPGSRTAPNPPDQRRP